MAVSMVVEKAALMADQTAETWADETAVCLVLLMAETMAALKVAQMVDM
jgi:hypothetical protein